MRTVHLRLSLQSHRGELCAVREFNIVLAGVGGQGTLLASEAIGIAAVKDELNVRVSEIHGMAQRGGAVVSTVRIGDEIYASTVVEGGAHALLGFEPFETLRSLKYASEKTLVIMNTEEIIPVELSTRSVKYPSIESIVEKINSFSHNTLRIEAGQLARKAGNVLAQNVVMLGALSGTGRLPIKESSMKKAVGELVPAKHVETNLRAFELGYENAKKQQRS